MRINKYFLKSVCLPLTFAIFLFSCNMLPKKPKELTLETIDYASVYKQANGAFADIAEASIEAGDRILLIGYDQFFGNTGWRFVPITPNIQAKEFSETLIPLIRSAHADKTAKGEEEVRYIRSLFELKQETGEYSLNTSHKDYNEAKIGWMLSRAGYTSIGSFDKITFLKEHPYFVEYLENGIINAIHENGGLGYERLSLAKYDREKESSHNRGEYVFNTLMLDYNKWEDIAKEFNINKILLYSINNVVAENIEYIGFQLGFTLIDADEGGEILWEGVKTTYSEDFPKEKVPNIGTITLSLPEAAVSKKSSEMVKKLADEDFEKGSRAVVMKVDDIPIIGNYPITREDFTVEAGVTDFFSQIEGLKIIQKLYKRQYKKSWQYTNAVYYLNPLLSGDYTEFSNYYGARYLITYRVLWKDQQGIKLCKNGETFDIQENVLGFYYKLIDMKDSGRIIISDFFPIASEKILEENVLYKGYKSIAEQQALVKELTDSGTLSEMDSCMLINRRMEIVNNYIAPKTEMDRQVSLTEKYLRTKETNIGLKNKIPSYNLQFELYMPVYNLFYDFDKEKVETKPANATAAATTTQTTTGEGGTAATGTGTIKAPEACDESKELLYIIAAEILQSWYEDGLCTALKGSGIALKEKLESIYSRYLLLKTNPNYNNNGDQYLTSLDMKRRFEQEAYLSPVFLEQWGGVIKGFYNIDKIIYFSLLETKNPEKGYIELLSPCPILQYFPILTYKSESMLVSILDVTSGAYLFNRNVEIK